jgi:hypothetical protein
MPDGVLHLQIMLCGEHFDRMLTGATGMHGVFEPGRQGMSVERPPFVMPSQKWSSP